MNKFNIHLISDSTGETVNHILQAVLVQFDNIEVSEHLWPLIKTTSHLERIIPFIKQNPGAVIYTIIDTEMREFLERHCLNMNIPCIAALDKVSKNLAAYFDTKPLNINPGKQHWITDEYLSKIEAINFAIAHDDGQLTNNLNKADIVVVGASRTSKSPTCIYLAYRGFKAANIPFVLNCPLPDNLTKLTNPLIVGLTIRSERLCEIRKNRLLSIGSEIYDNYADTESIDTEIREAQKFFLRQKWPIVDVTKQSVEEVAAKIIQLYNYKKGIIS